jgi:hypothetical protein
LYQRQKENKMKIGDLVEFSYGRLGGQIDGIGLLAGTINDDAYEILYMEKVYRVHKQFVKPISIKRKDSVNDVKNN